MGLDQYAYHCDASALDTKQVDFEECDLEAKQIQCWRKHPDLQGWMEALYREKGGMAKDFNCTTVRLLAEDLDRLEVDIKNSALPKTTGFFFGRSYGTEDEEGRDLRFVIAARKLLAQGRAVYYSSWW
jgi:hypothetical protein